jgi:hypothetical protein
MFADKKSRIDGSRWSRKYARSDRSGRLSVSEHRRGCCVERLMLRPAKKSAKRTSAKRAPAKAPARKAKAAKSPVRKRAANEVIAEVPAKKPVAAAPQSRPYLPRRNRSCRRRVPPLWRRRYPRRARVRSAPIPSRLRNRDPNLQKSGLSARGTAESFPGYHWRFSAQTSSNRSSRARRNVTVADQGIVNAPSSSTVTWICSPWPL